MNKSTDTLKSAAQVAAGQLKKIAKRNEAKPKGVLAVVTKGLIKAMAPKR